MYLGRYEVIRKIGSGGFGEVLLARSIGAEGFERIVAVKRLRGELARKEGSLQGIINEARIGGLLNHPNVVQVLEFIQVGTDYLLVMEYVDGIGLQELLELEKANGLIVEPAHALEVIIQACEGLHYAHAARSVTGEPLKLIHRDIKPSNLMITRTGTVKVMDFGVARSATNTGQSSTGSIKGTLRYLSPEQAEGSKEIRHESDLFSLGLVLCEMLTRKPVYEAEQEHLVLLKALQGRNQDAIAQAESIVVGLSPILKKCLAFNPDERYRSADELAQALRQIRLKLPSNDGLASLVEKCLSTRKSDPYLDEVSTETSFSLELRRREDGTARHGWELLKSEAPTEEISRKAAKALIAAEQEKQAAHTEPRNLEDLMTTSPWEWEWRVTDDPSGIWMGDAFDRAAPPSSPLVHVQTPQAATPPANPVRTSGSQGNRPGSGLQKLGNPAPDLRKTDPNYRPNPELAQTARLSSKKERLAPVDPDGVKTSVGKRQDIPPVRSSLPGEVRSATAKSELAGGGMAGNAAAVAPASPSVVSLWGPGGLNSLLGIPAEPPAPAPALRARSTPPSVPPAPVPSASAPAVAAVPPQASAPVVTPRPSAPGGVSRIASAHEGRDDARSTEVNVPLYVAQKIVAEARAAEARAAGASSLEAHAPSAAPGAASAPPLSPDGMREAPPAISVRGVSDTSRDATIKQPIREILRPLTTGNSLDVDEVLGAGKVAVSAKGPADPHRIPAALDVDAHPGAAGADASLKDTVKTGSGKAGIALARALEKTANPAAANGVVNGVVNGAAEASRRGMPGAEKAGGSKAGVVNDVYLNGAFLSADPGVMDLTVHPPSANDAIEAGADDEDEVVATEESVVLDMEDVLGTESVVMDLDSVRMMVRTTGAGHVRSEAQEALDLRAAVRTDPKGRPVYPSLPPLHPVTAPEDETTFEMAPKGARVQTPVETSASHGVEAPAELMAAPDEAEAAEEAFAADDEAIEGPGAQESAPLSASTEMTTSHPVIAPSSAEADASLAAQETTPEAAMAAGEDDGEDDEDGDAYGAAVAAEEDDAPELVAAFIPVPPEAISAAPVPPQAPVVPSPRVSMAPVAAPAPAALSVPKTETVSPVETASTSMDDSISAAEDASLSLASQSTVERVLPSSRYKRADVKRAKVKGMPFVTSHTAEIRVDEILAELDRTDEQSIPDARSAEKPKRAELIARLRQAQPETTGPTDPVGLRPELPEWEGKPSSRPDGTNTIRLDDDGAEAGQDSIRTSSGRTRGNTSRLEVATGFSDGTRTVRLDTQSEETGARVLTPSSAYGDTQVLNSRTSSPLISVLEAPRPVPTQAGISPRQFVLGFMLGIGLLAAGFMLGVAWERTQHAHALNAEQARTTDK